MGRRVVGRIGSAGYESLAEPTPDEIAAFDRMVALQCPPGAVVGRSYEQNREGYKEFDGLSKVQTDFYRRRYRQLTGQDMPQSGWYDKEIARFPGDPMAHVKDKDDVLRVAKARKMNLSGPITTVNNHGEADEARAKKKPGLAPDIVERYVNDKVQKNPALALKPRQELREMVIDQHGPK